MRRRVVWIRRVVVLLQEELRFVVLDFGRIRSLFKILRPGEAATERCSSAATHQTITPRKLTLNMRRRRSTVALSTWTAASTTRTRRPATSCLKFASQRRRWSMSTTMRRTTRRLRNPWAAWKASTIVFQRTLRKATASIWSSTATLAKRRRRRKVLDVLLSFNIASSTATLRIALALLLNVDL